MCIECTYNVKYIFTNVCNLKVTMSYKTSKYENDQELTMVFVVFYCVIFQDVNLTTFERLPWM